MAATPGAHSQTASPQTAIRPGEVWLDDRGKPIQAHGGGVIQLNGAFYWFGEDRSPGNDPNKRYVAGYTSRDLVHWHFMCQCLVLDNPDNLGPNVIVERPKVFFNKTTGKYVMYFHLDGPGPGGPYGYARVGVAVGDRIDGPFHYVHSFRLSWPGKPRHRAVRR
jgi:hypothetical protein